MKTSVLLLLLSLPALAGPDVAIPWSKSIDEAKKAAAEKKPIAVLLVQKGCPLSGEMLKALVRDERMADLAPGFAWLTVVVGTEEYKDWFLKTCGGNVEGTPSLVFLNPKGENADPAYAGLATVTSPDADDIVPVLREVLQRAKQEEPDKDRDAVRDAVEKAKAAKTPAEAIAAHRAAIRAGDGWKPEEERMASARDEIERLLQQGSAEMLRILREVRDAEGQKAAYEKVKAEYAGTSVAEWAGEEALKVRKK